MPPSTDNPPSAARVQAIRRLHAIGARRGLSHEDLRAVCGVPSLARLSADELQRHADRLEADRPERLRGYRSGRVPLPRGEVRLEGDATTRQRRRIEALLEQLAWPPATCAHWLATRHNVTLAELRGNGFIDRGVATAIITQLDRAAAKLAQPSSAGAARAPQSLGPSVPQSLPPETPF